MRKLLGLLLTLSLMLSGCGWMDGSYVHISDHRDQGPPVQEQILAASSYLELENVLSQMVRSGTSEGLIYLYDYAQNTAESGMYVVSRWLTTTDPVGAYAVSDVEYEIGSNSGKPAIAVRINYRHTPMEIQQINEVKNIKAAEEAVGYALEALKPGIVLLIEEYESVDFVQMAADYAQSHPQIVMEAPQVTEAVYGTDASRIVELNMTYRSSRDSLKLMRQQVEPVFEAARLYVSDDAPILQQYAQLYSFLMERFDYRIQPSITPSYSLLHHGVGDSNAFAIVYQAMCRSVDLDCRVITGTRDGEPWTWNLIDLGGYYGHVDLLQNSAANGFHVMNAQEMQGYVWDYSAAPSNSMPEDAEDAMGSEASAAADGPASAEDSGKSQNNP